MKIFVGLTLFIIGAASYIVIEASKFVPPEPPAYHATPTPAPTPETASLTVFA